jgi:hypothetical protein
MRSMGIDGKANQALPPTHAASRSHDTGAEAAT